MFQPIRTNNTELQTAVNHTSTEGRHDMLNPYAPANISETPETHSFLRFRMAAWFLIFTVAFISLPCLNALIESGLHDFLYITRSSNWGWNFFVRLPAYAGIQFALIEWQFRSLGVRSTFPSWRFVFPLFAGFLNFQLYEWFRYPLEKLIGLTIDWPLHRGLEGLAFLTTTMVVVGVTDLISSRCRLRLRRTSEST